MPMAMYGYSIVSDNSDHYLVLRYVLEQIRVWLC